MRGKVVPILSFVVVMPMVLLALLLAVSAHLDPTQAIDFSELLSMSKAQATDLRPVAVAPADGEPSLAEKLRARPLR